MIEKPSQFLEDPEADETEQNNDPVEILPYTPDSADETVRKSGLAWVAGIVLFASVMVMLLIGWLLDKYFATSPRYMVIGILLGAVVGFYQFFRITSQILRK